MATFVDDATLTTATTAANTMHTASLPANWGDIIPRANIRAYNRIRAVLLGRGFTLAEFTAWGNGTDTDGYDWNLRVGVVCAFIEASKSDEDRGAAYRQELADLLKELKDEPIVIDGEATYPTGSGGRVGSGDIDTSEDRFTFDEPDSGRFPLPGDGTRL